MYIDFMEKKDPGLQTLYFAYVDFVEKKYSNYSEIQTIYIFAYKSILVVVQLNLKWNGALNVENAEHAGQNGGHHKVCLKYGGHEYI